MPILALPPTPQFAEASFRLASNTLAHTSALNKTTQTVEFPGARWRLEAAHAALERAEAEVWQAFLAELDGMAGRFYAGDPLGGTPRGAVGASAPRVNGAGQSGKTLIADGWDTSVTGVFLKGDYFAIDLPSGGRSLHKAVADHDSDGGGNATLSFRPALRESPTENAPLIIAAATCVMRLIDDDQAGWRESAGNLYGISFAAVESFDTG